MRAQRVASDNADGTFTNPVIPADYPDPDVIRVGDDYYMVSSDFHSVPGDPLLHSKDLVNWEVIGHAIPHYDDDSRYSMKGGTRYGLGSWAPSLRYHDGTFYVLYNTNDHGAYISRSKSPAGPWKINALHVSLYDPGLFFEDDGTVWVVSGQVALYLTELSADLRSVKTAAKLIYQGQAKHYDEGSHIYKRNGYYYILTATARPDLLTKYALQVERSRSLSGLFETKVIFTDDANWKNEGLHQGAFVQTQRGDWWALLFQDRFDFGREPMLQPVTWVNNWPVVGIDGRAVITYKKPATTYSYPPVEMKRSDNFNAPKLGIQWEWNHNPDDTKWTLRERPGFLRLKTATVTQSWRTARNTIWQRLVEGGEATVTAKLDVSGMRDGDIAGLGMFQVGTSSIGVTDAHSSRMVVVRNQDKVVAQNPIPPKRSDIWLRLQTPEFKAETRYSYSLDGRQFSSLGGAQPMLFQEPGIWIGQRISLFNYATKHLGGYVDVDSFVYNTPDRNNIFQANDRIDAQRYDEIDKGHVQWIHDPEANGTPVKVDGSNRMAVGSFAQGGWLKFNHVNFGDGVELVRMNVATADIKKIELHLESPQGPLVASCTLKSTSAANKFETQTFSVKSYSGMHALYLVFANDDDRDAAIAWFTFGKTDARR